MPTSDTRTADPRRFFCSSPYPTWSRPRPSSSNHPATTQPVEVCYHILVLETYHTYSVGTISVVLARPRLAFLFPLCMISVKNEQRSHYVHLTVDFAILHAAMESCNKFLRSMCLRWRARPLCRWDSFSALSPKSQVHEHAKLIVSHKLITPTWLPLFVARSWWWYPMEQRTRIRHKF
ncbi:hypothetical protein BJY04DRAFT_186270 [Aspergillus karnatakaensis]|uniref:uncharacterized protein n=1 Tax=Aspergillus karnatakaensis TaxID=1810916 RepID=UPI003CCCAA65